jgi:hypothetical protein
MEDMLQESRYFLKKGRGLWFGFALAATLLTVAWQLFGSAVLSVLAGRSMAGLAEAIGVAVNVILYGGMAAVLLGYALNNTVRVYKVLFILLACSQLPLLLESILSGIYTIQMTAGRSGINVSLTTVTLLCTGPWIIAWVACPLIIAFSRKASRAVRVSSILLAIYVLLSAVWSVARSLLTPTLYERFGMEGFILFSVINALLISALSLGLNVFFYAAMAFSRRKDPVVLLETPAEGVSIGIGEESN